ncbi:AAA family ATPase [Algoriphagus halophytocola]|uniref:AAA family ATPase n=1 Tax=Algoriphagus halophytocola TaxID=2991499 RepID=UPI002FD395B6
MIPSIYLLKDRKLLSLLQENLSIFPAVGLLGPRQVGKTTLVKDLKLDRESIYIDLEKASDRTKLVDAELLLITLTRTGTHRDLF